MTDPMKRDEATARPWRVAGCRTHILSDAGGVCKFESIHGLYKNHEANAALIVTAVNERPALLAALDEAKKALETARSELIFKFLQSAGALGFGLTWIEYVDKCGTPPAIKKIDAALSKLNEAVDGK